MLAIGITALPLHKSICTSIEVYVSVQILDRLSCFVWRGARLLCWYFLGSHCVQGERVDGLTSA